VDASSLPLRDVIGPLALGWWPPAPGWWLIFVVILLLLSGLVRLLIMRFRNPYTALRKAALCELGSLQLINEADDGQFAERVSSLLKRVAIVRYAEQKPAKLSGITWLAFLDNANTASGFSLQGGDALLNAQYQTRANINREGLIDASRAWIKAI
jgi:hypothetical protein